MDEKDKLAAEIVGAIILLAIVAAIIDATLPKAPTDNEEQATTAEPLSQTSI